MTNTLTSYGVSLRRPHPGLRSGSLILVILWLFLALQPAYHPAAAGPLDRLDCMPGYTATVYAHGLDSPDGLAFAPDGTLYVAEEDANRVSRIDAGGHHMPVLSDLRSPEGVAFDPAGNLYVVEDARNGRLIRMTPDGESTTLADGLDAPEGVAVLTRPDAQGHDAVFTVYVTESNIQLLPLPYDLASGITAVSQTGDKTTVVSHSPRLRGLDVAFWSYAGLTAGPEGYLYVTNELSGRRLVREISLFSGRLNHSFKVLTSQSIFAIDPADGTRTLVAEDLLGPEGLRFSADGDFPLYVAEESIGNRGRLSRIERDGRRTTVCDRFRGVEDVVVDANGDLYVSEDGSGFVIRISVPEHVDTSASPPLVSPTVDLLPHSDRLWRIVNQLVAMVRNVLTRLL